MADALHTRGVPTVNKDGLALWMPVAAESEALVTLADVLALAAIGHRNDQ